MKENNLATPARTRPAISAFLLVAFLALAFLPTCGAGGGKAIQAKAADGTVLGPLVRLDDFPLYELRYEARYDLDSLVALAAARGGQEEVTAAEGGASGASGDFACTCFAAIDAEGHRVMGRNFDWQKHPALVLFTAPPEGYASVSLVDLHYLGYSPSQVPEKAPAALVRAPALPFDGMNEKGLAVGMMAVERADGISRKGGEAARPKVGELGVIRILLDRAADVEEAIALLGRYDVDLGDPPIHYMIADRKGASVVVEYLDGEPSFLRGDKGWQVSTNFLFSDLDSSAWTDACPRYALVSGRLAAADGRIGEAGVLGLLAAVSQANTQWSSAYYLETGNLELALDGDFGKVRRWDLRLAAEGIRKGR